MSRKGTIEEALALMGLESYAANGGQRKAEEHMTQNTKGTSKLTIVVYTQSDTKKISQSKNKRLANG